MRPVEYDSNAGGSVQCPSCGSTGQVSGGASRAHFSSGNPDGFQQYVKSRIYQATGAANGILAEIDAIRQLDASKEKLKKVWGGIALIPLVIGIGLACLQFIPDEPRFPVVAFTIMMVVAAAGFIFSLYKYIQHSRLDVPNWRYETAAALIRMLDTDMVPGAEVEIRLDLREPTHKTKGGRKGRRGRVSIQRYLDRWLSLDGRLADGTRFGLQLVEKVEQRVKHKRKSSVTKERCVLGAKLLLWPKEKRYGALDPLSQRLDEAVRLPEWARMAGVSVASDVLRLDAMSDRGAWNDKPRYRQPAEPDSKDPRPVAVDLAAMMFLSLYHGLNLLRQRADGSRGTDAA